MRCGLGSPHLFCFGGSEKDKVTVAQLRLTQLPSILLLFMPSISTLLNQYETGLWREYHQLVDTLRAYAVWRHEEDGLKRDNGLPMPPRFVAVLESEHTFKGYAKVADMVSEINTKWPPRFYDETWGWARVHVGTGVHSKRLKTGVPVDIARVTAETEQKAIEVIQELEVAGHSGIVKDGHLIVTPGPSGLTARESGGRAFKLRAWSEEGELLHTVSVGVIVCRGIRQGVREARDAPRKRRKDSLQQVAAWEDVTFWQ